MKKNKNLIAGIIVAILSIALFFDLKYKGLFYRLFLPKKVQSYTERLFGGK